MRKILGISTMCVAILMVLLSTVFPHHHHLGEVCTAIERCAIDGNDNDEHTHHHGDEEDGCTLRQMHQFVVCDSVGHAHPRCPLPHLLHSPMALAAYMATIPAYHPSVYTLLYYIEPSADAFSMADAHGRRAPPAVDC